jgi:hypothetical protein
MSGKSLRIDFDVSQVEDRSTKDILQRIRDYLRDFPLFNGDWKFFQFTFDVAEDRKKIPHGLNFRPLDVLQTAIINPEDGAVIWHID